MMVSVHSVYEQISLAEEERTRACMIATNIYMRTERGWRMMAHHASPAPPVEPAAGQQQRRAKTLH
jgi:hypothetical protein